MTDDLGAWLREHREAHGWTKREMANRIIEAGCAVGDKSMPGLDTMRRNVRRWENGQDKNITERYKLHICRALGIAPAQFGSAPAVLDTGTATPSPTLAPATPLRVASVGLPPQIAPNTYTLADPGLGEPLVLGYRGMQESDMGDSMVKREVLMAAHEGSEHAEHAEQRGIGDATLEQLRADVARLSHEYMTGEPLPLFLEMRRVRSRMHDALERRMWPRDATDLYFLLGCVNALMAVTADGLGYPQAAEELIRAGWAYAVAIDHRPLMARLRLELARIVYWGGRPRQSLEIGRSGLQYLEEGPNAALLYLVCGRASASISDTGSARASITAAEEARGRKHADELAGIGGAFGFTRAYHHCLAGTVLAFVPGSENEAVTELERALDRYAAGRVQGGERGYWGDEAHARIELAAARLRVGGLDAAADALEPVLSLAPSRRVDPLRDHLRKVHAELSAPIFLRSASARQLDERIEQFGQDSIATGLGSLTRSTG